MCSQPLPKPNWCVYLLLCNNQALYCGISNQPEQRFHLHQSGKGAKYTRMHAPIEMRIVADSMNKSTAASCEYTIKQENRQQKQNRWQNAMPLSAWLQQQSSPTSSTV